MPFIFGLRIFKLFSTFGDERSKTHSEENMQKEDIQEAIQSETYFEIAREPIMG